MLDPIIGFFIGILILKTAYEIGKENILHIMGFVPNHEDLDAKIRRVANKTPNASDAHAIKIDNFASYLIVHLHVKVDASLTVQQADEITSQVEQDILRAMPEIRYVSVKPCPFDSDVCKENIK